MIEIKITHANLDKIAKTMVKAEKRAVNKTLKQTRNRWAKVIYDELNLPLATIKKAIRYTQAQHNGIVTIDSTKAGLGINSHSKKRSTPLTAFKARQTKKGIRVKIKRKGKSALIKHAFLAGVIGGDSKQNNQQRLASNGSGHHAGVFLRKTSDRLPIKELRTTAIENTGSDHIKEIQKFANNKFKQIYYQQLKYELSKINRNR